MINRIRSSVAVCCLVAIAAVSAACGTGTAGPVTTPGEMEWSSATQAGPTETRTARWTDLPTAGPIPTVEPMVTPSPGPAPELEIFNVTFSKTTTNIDTFFGEIRNNGDQPAIFPGRLKALKLGLERWRTDENILFSHRIFDAFIEPGVDEKSMNCIIYPGETGIIAFSFNLCSGTGNCVGEWEELSAPPAQLGYRLLNYETYPKRWEEFRQFPMIKSRYPVPFDDNYHMQINSLMYQKELRAMLFDFDLSFYYGSYQSGAHLPVWIILFDKEGRIINVATNEWINIPCEGFGCATSGTSYHISGAVCNWDQCMWDAWKKEDPKIQWFKPIADLTVDEVNKVDRVRLLAENQDKRICIDTDFDMR
jgi:hypothetical protein